MSKEVQKQIESLNEKFMDFFNKGDSVAVSELYTNDGQLLPPNSNIITGKAAIQGFWQGAMDMGIKSVKLEIAEFESFGESAVEISNVTLKGSENQVIDKGKYMVIWKNENGQWKLHRDIWNSSMPLK